MKVIDSDNYRESGIDAFFFPGGEPHARIPENFGDALLWLKARTWDDVGIAVCVLNALRYQGQSKSRKVWLFCPYFPGARQDRTDYRTPVTREIYGRLLGQYVDRFYTFDLHSSVHFAGLHIEKNFMPADMLNWVTEGGLYVIAPDAGAVERAQSFADMVSDYYGERYRGLVPVVQCEKHRDFATGKFTGFTLPPLPGVGTYVIVDDICDGGGTFNLLAEAFLRDSHGPDSKLHLFVSHGIFSKGLNAIHSKIESIITTDSFTDITTTGTVATPDRLDVISLRPVIDEILEESDE